MRGLVAIRVVVGAGLLLTACADPPLIDGLFTEAEWMKVARFSPLPDRPASPTNKYADREDAAAFGQMMFFEARYSGPIAVEGPGQLGEPGVSGLYSCASCHDTKRWFVDTRVEPIRAVSTGAAQITRRNAPSLVNIAYYEWGGWAGAQDQFWKQGANSPETKDLAGDRLAIAHVIYEHYRTEYEALFDHVLDPALAYDDMSGRFPPRGKPKDPGGINGPWEGMDPDDQEHVNEILANLGKAFEAYERRLISGNSPFDQYVSGDFNALSSSAKRGLKLFIGKAGCDTCHQDQTFTDQKFHNTAVRQTPPFDLGRFDDVLRLDNPFNGAGEYSDDPAAGAEKLEGIVRTEEMKGQFRTKSLRQIAHTGPYFHDGSVATLEEVVRHYNQGGASESYPGTKSPLLVPLNLTESEIKDLVAFLESLTGEPVPEMWTEDTSKP